MSQKTQNKFLVGYGAVTGVVGLALAYLCWSANSDSTEAAEKLEGAKRKLEGLRSAPIFPKPEHVSKKTQEVSVFKAEVDKLGEAVLAFQKPLDPAISPDDLKQKLGKYKTQIDGLAKGRSVGLPQDFGLGLNRYLTESPTKAATPKVDYLVEAANWLVNNLLDSGISRLDAINCPEMPYEKAAEEPKPAANIKDKPKTSSASANKATTKKSTGSKEEPAALEESKVLTRFPISVTFTGSEQAVSDAMNKLASTGPGGPFFVTKSLRIENEKKEGPQRQTGFTASPVPAAEGEAKKEVPAMVDARYILGNEKVTARLEIDLVRFEGTPATSAAPAPPAPTSSTPAPAKP